MADEITKLPEDVIAKRIARGKELLEISRQLTAEEERKLQISVNIAKNVEQAIAGGDVRIEQLKKQKEGLDETQKSQAKQIDQAVANVETLQKIGKNQEDSVRKLAAAAKSTQSDLGNINQSIVESGKLAEVSARTNEKSLDSFKRVADAAAGGVEGTLEAMGQGMTAALMNPELIAAMAFPGLGTSLKEVQEEVMKMPAELDKNVRGMVKSTGLGVKEMGTTLIGALDPQFAVRMGVEMKKGLEPLDSIGLKSEEVAGAVTALVNDVAMFRPKFMEQDKASAMFLANLTAGMNKIGLKVGTTTKLLNTFTKAIKTSPAEAGKSIKRIASIADSLGLSVGQVGENFAAVTTDISMYGDRMVDVFGDLQAQAQATGVSISRLSKFAEGLDTFDGAAKAAQSLNAVLGDSVVSVTDLVHADPAEKIAMIQDAIARSGVDFETADRRMKQVIANAAGFSDVEEAAKVLLNKDEALESADALDTAAMSQEQLRAKIDESLTVGEQMTKGLSNMAGGMQQVLDTVRPGAVKFANVLTNSFAGIVDKTENSAAAVVAFSGGLKGLSIVGEAASDALGKLGKSMAPFLGNKYVQVAASVASVLGLGFSAVQMGEGVFDEGKAALDRGPSGGPDVGKEGRVLSPPTQNTTATAGDTDPNRPLLESTKELTDKLNEKSDQPVIIQLQMQMGDQVTEQQYETFINMLDGKTSPLKSG